MKSVVKEIVAQKAAQLPAKPASPQPRRAAFDFNGRDVLTRLGRLLPDFVLKKIARMLRFAGDETEPDLWAGGSFAMVAAGALCCSLVVSYFLAPTRTGVISAFEAGMLFFLLFTLAACTTYYLGLFYAGFERARRIERAMPDYFLLMAGSLNAGMTPFAAFRSAARPEFGPLEQEVRYASARTAGGVSIGESLGQLGTGIDSVLAQKSLQFLQKGINNGGKLAKLLESTSAQMRRSQELQEELVASTRSQAVFLFFVVALVMPLLLAISLNFIDAVASIRAVQTQGEQIAGALPFGSAVSITHEFAFWFSISFMVATALLSSLLAGVISTGRLAYGAKYFPVVLFVSLAAYLLAVKMIGGLLAGFS